MKSVPLKVVRNQEIAEETYEMILSGELVQEMNRPGTFLHIKVPSSHHVLRRPISIASVNQELGTCTLVYKCTGEGTRALTNVRPNDCLQVLGPLGGQGFPTEEPSTDQGVTLIGGGVGVPPMYFAARSLSERNIPFRVILGFQNEAAVFYEEAFRQLRATDVTIMTDDGSYGEKGTVIDALQNLEQPSTYIYTCGPRGMLKAVKAAAHHDTTVYVSLEEHMGCGIGACFACVCKTEDETSYVKICTDGPVFQSNEVLL
ncbi:dihydroorotate dehydrogenase electron transfer subunit [Geomicrobium sp. JCM 19038]|uniref:dihydroorotate dehydrogenase electron transfer subunit n=1 Tax=Geomicrobium sp. JCM 19038 TaxID=1460635 RepID=UPI00045F39E9|nr:dihydroorotate dehydrogenase electron transfer subunit [Geomicrobium sp. JCM 19038]GAK07450.1 dihydroorotate dehydrogenase electron transfer subunit [Geomicrobium sp. JCM 19038]